MSDVFGALVRNEMRRFFRNKIAAFRSFAFPLCLFAVLFFAKGGDKPGTVPVQFAESPFSTCWTSRSNQAATASRWRKAPAR